MFSDYIIFGVGFYVFGLIVSAIWAFLGASFKKSTYLFILANCVGFLSAFGYFLNFSGQTLALFHFDFFFAFAPRLNFLAAVFFMVVSGVAALVGVYSLRYLDLYKEEYSPRTVQFLMSIFVLGMQGVLIANNTFAFLFFWEVMSMASFFLVFSDKKPESIQAAFLYFIMTHLGASAILGAFLILGGGSFFFSLDSLRSASQNLSPAMNALAFSLFAFGFGSKAGLVPFHVWLPEAHPQAPSNISAMMSGLMLKIAIYGFIFIALGMANVPAIFGFIIIFLGIISGLVGALYAVVERDIKKTFAYSSIENMGIIFTILGLAIYLSAFHDYQSIVYALVAFAIFHAINHSLFKTALFLSSGVIISRVHTKSLELMGGIAKLMPVFSSAFLIAILAALPLPLFGTFYGEWGLIRNVVTLLGMDNIGMKFILLLLIVLAAVALVSALAIFAMIKAFSISMLGASKNAHMEKRGEKSDALMIAPIMLLGVGVVALGFLAAPFVAGISENMQSLSEGASFSAPMRPVEISSLAVSGAIVLFGVLIYAIQKIFFIRKNERVYHTWDCGQPVDATMQYSATAFSAPIRFFFLTFIGRKKVMQSEAVVETNPWIRRYSFSLSIRPKWSDVMYAPIAKGLLLLAKKARYIQSGRIQYYILFLLLALIITLIFAL